MEIKDKIQAFLKLSGQYISIFQVHIPHTNYDVGIWTLKYLTKSLPIKIGFLDFNVDFSNMNLEGEDTNMDPTFKLKWRQSTRMINQFLWLWEMGKDIAHTTD